jgi:hypothetical protein
MMVFPSIEKKLLEEPRLQNPQPSTKARNYMQVSQKNTRRRLKHALGARRAIVPFIIH